VRACYILHPTSHTLHRTLYALRLTLNTSHPTPYTLHPAPCIRHPTSDTLHPTPHTLHRKPRHYNCSVTTEARRTGTGEALSNMGGGWRERDREKWRRARCARRHLRTPVLYLTRSPSLTHALSRSLALAFSLTRSFSPSQLQRDDGGAEDGDGCSALCQETEGALGALGAMRNRKRTVKVNVLTLSASLRRLL
jgi:hypothetical protein